MELLAIVSDRFSESYRVSGGILNEQARVNAGDPPPWWGGCIGFGNFFDFAAPVVQLEMI